VREDVVAAVRDLDHITVAELTELLSHLRVPRRSALRSA
jgi:hypothetical protein